MAETLLLWQCKPTQLCRTQVEPNYQSLQAWPEVLNALQCISESVKQKRWPLQAALDRRGNAKPSTSHSAQPGQNAQEAANSGNMASTSKRKDNKRQQQPVTQLLEDQALNAELDAANTGGMVETERDRLIRIVSAQNSV